MKSPIREKTCFTDVVRNTSTSETRQQHSSEKSSGWKMVYKKGSSQSGNADWRLQDIGNDDASRILVIIVKDASNLAIE